MFIIVVLIVLRMFHAIDDETFRKNV